MIEIITAIGLIVGSIYLLTIIGYPFYVKWGIFKSFYHDVMYWHRPDNGPKTFDGCTFHAKCKHCGKNIMQDCQGNWF